MTTLDDVQFSEFFEAVWGHQPFLWQQDLCTQVLADNCWPDVIDLPTGSGKTAALDVALFCLAARPKVFPRRIVFVIDRRIIVDQVARRAEALEKAFATASSGALLLVAQALTALGGGADALKLGTLRGGVRRSDDWAKWPDQASVIVSTVDQFGSRLLFRGYGVSPGMWPIHAGLAGNDCLILLDEVHLAEPFRQTLAAISERFASPDVVPRRWKVVEMSATPGSGDVEPFRLEPERHIDGAQNAELRRRVTAKKHATLVRIGKKNEAAEVVLAVTIPLLVERLRKAAGNEAVIGVVLNRVASARAVAAALAKDGVQTRLVTGRMRPLDRDDTMAEVEQAADPSRSEKGTGLVVVATQCIEVGADLSFDALITEVAPLDALRQRFGRLDRRGMASDRGEPAEAIIVGVESAVLRLDDPVYGAKLNETWVALTEAFGESMFDVGPMSPDLVQLPGNLVAAKTDAPILLPSHLDVLVQTNPTPLVQPTISQFLHGPQEMETDVSLVWRADLGDLVGHDEAVKMLLVACPPAPGEMMPVPLAAIRRWLTGGDEVEVADVEGVLSDADLKLGKLKKWFLVCRGGEVLPPTDNARSIRPGDVVVVPASYGGMHRARDANDGNWDPTSTAPVIDRGDTAQERSGRAAVMRLHPALLSGLTHFQLDENQADKTTISEWLDANTDAPSVGAFLSVTNGKWLHSVVPGWDGTSYRDYRMLRPRKPRLSAASFDGSDALNSFTGTKVLLDDHLSGVGRMAELFASNLDLPDTIVEDFGLAGRLHDLGKVDPRFQQWLLGTDLDIAINEEPLAKSLVNTSSIERQRARAASKYPAGMRHELLSLAMIEDVAALRSKANDWDLVQHLVSTHHGYCRPLPPFVTDADPQPVQHAAEGVEMVATTGRAADPGLDMTERFWVLVRRYGWFGLAWFESIFRLADHRQSERESNSEAKRD